MTLQVENVVGFGSDYGLYNAIIICLKYMYKILFLSRKNPAQE